LRGKIEQVADSAPGHQLDFAARFCAAKSNRWPIPPQATIITHETLISCPFIAPIP
jgi:hypothetical protein